MVGIHPDHAYSTWQLAKFVECPTAIHWVPVQQVLKYISSSKHFGQRYGGPGGAFVLIAFVEADWTGNITAKKSMRGCLKTMGGAAM